MTFRLGLTGSIGMGKSTTAQMFRDLGHPVWDADQAVHRLYAPGGSAVAPVAAAFPEALAQGGIDRGALKTALAADPAALARLEGIVHPLVARDRQDFLARHVGAPLVVLDIPLLFESAHPPDLDGVAVVSTDPATQAARVLARPGMTRDTLAMILARQMPDADKRSRADWIIPTDSLDGARAAVARIVNEVAPHA
ncbi:MULTISPECIES: dephospho-CoA kinase [Paracoccus]|uniref:dephospho-CoA kinase n=1 Tax=Paracoccus TaxID=265 RepID=UPI0005E256D2|nr:MULTISPECIES: dephospho-CoA kinase [Paracoccus]KIX17462.1 dephospho-CoA kinase [Paracoccus sp. 228]|tara:strand:+ start:3200 stop:3787 length:588 start_codon:yes stop_codon:yes gene_type:complete